MRRIDMFIQFVSEVKRFVAVFAVVGERAGKVNILNVVLRVGPLPVNHPAQGASVLCLPLIHNLLYVFKQHFAREPAWKELCVLKRFIFSCLGRTVCVLCEHACRAGF